MDILTQKQYKDYSRLSRYSVVPIFYNTQDRKYLHGSSFWLKDDIPYQIYTVRENDSYDLIALKFYNNPTHYWIICDFNRVINPIEAPKVGTQLKVPSISNLEFDIK